MGSTLLFTGQEGYQGAVDAWTVSSVEMDEWHRCHCHADVRPSGEGGESVFQMKFRAWHFNALFRGIFLPLKCCIYYIYSKFERQRHWEWHFQSNNFLSLLGCRFYWKNHVCWHYSNQIVCPIVLAAGVGWVNSNITFFVSMLLLAKRHEKTMQNANLKGNLKGIFNLIHPH